MCQTLDNIGGGAIPWVDAKVSLQSLKEQALKEYVQGSFYTLFVKYFIALNTHLVCKSISKRDNSVFLCLEWVYGGMEET